ncbi:MAG: four helix bundle protein [Deltaproteobacteria bacterium]|nr:four helix bundle protein [Deltaproteobacteria bacterium]MBW2562909.1 four helix bundle protein [Deltaproteobacteria bacterium]
MEHANSFKELVVYQKSRTLAQSIFKITKAFPKEEMYSLTDQIRRSSRSIGAQIAEAWGKRRYEKHFISKLSDADAEQLETQHWIIIAQDCEYLTHKQFETLNQNLSEIGRMLYSMMKKANQFCSVTTDH